MEANKGLPYADNLWRRRREIDLTLRHLENERRQVETNTEWANDAAYHSRIELLERLTGWYRDEISQIEATIDQAEKAAAGTAAHATKPSKLNP